MPCAEAMRVQAYFDGEVDAVAASDIEGHLENCAECRALIEDLGRLRAAMAGSLALERAPVELHERVRLALDAQVPRSTVGSIPRSRSFARAAPFRLGALGGFGVAAAAASLAFLLLPPRSSPLLDEILSAHVRSLMPSHLIDVESTDLHTVKPWFAGHADVSPAVADFADKGFRLVGGRADYLDRQRSAAVVYQHGAHMINVFSWNGAADALPADTTRSGYRMLFWSEGNLHYCAVSDAGWEELRVLARLLRDASRGTSARE